MKNLIKFLILLHFTIFFSCTKDTSKPYIPVKRCPDLTNHIDTIRKYISGEWKFIEEKRYDRYNGIQYFTPESPGWNKIELKLSHDTAFFFVNDYIDSIYNFKLQKLSDFTYAPADSLPVIVYYSFHTGLRKSQVPIMVCSNQLLMLHQYVSSIVGERLWMRK